MSFLKLVLQEQKNLGRQLTPQENEELKKLYDSAKTTMVVHGMHSSNPERLEDASANFVTDVKKSGLTIGEFKSKKFPQSLDATISHLKDY